MILFPTTTRGRELAGMAAIDLNSGVLVEVIEMKLEGDQVRAVRPVYAGKLLTEVVCNAKPQLITLRARAFDKPEADTSRSGTVTEAATDYDKIKPIATKKLEAVSA